MHDGFIDQFGNKIPPVFLDRERCRSIEKNLINYPAILYQQSQKSQKGFSFISRQFLHDLLRGA